ncbi:MAG: glucosaminidase domain-containing protein [Peptoniphilaceae bacterium]|uniref:glucosaminidase domain-containing protein n=1 Tax=Parvimonas sp. TaxID=1944660 RepID=UPI002A751E61|nr:glucosaminidase domain-containing protein [Parvimonas sp.]MDD7765520.1 glucosaminidase domain-containing protein [Peptoniphilaceae bacterium]MDY3051061.1 glucosaminidase domain-containing protein [Parvimonas sp.]
MKFKNKVTISCFVIGGLLITSHNFNCNKVFSAESGYSNGKFYGDDKKLANWWYDDGTEWYFFQNGVKHTGYGTDGNGKRFFDNGKYANWWYDDGTAWYFFQNGEKHTGYGTDANGKRYFVKGKYANGIYEGKNFVDGVYKNSVKKGYVDGKFYGDDGKLANWWYDDGTEWYFFQDGVKHTGYGTDGNGKRFFDNGKYANWWHDDGNDWFFFKEGVKHSGYGTDANGKRFFDNGKYANWWYDDGNDWFFFKEGVKFSGEAKDASGLRKFVNGKYATDGYSFGEWIFKDGKKYLSDGNGGYQKGFARDNNGDLYYFSTFDGSMQVDFLAYDKSSSSYYKVGSDGIAVRTNSPRTDFIKIVAPSMVNAVRGKGLFPSIAIAQICLETGFGSSTLGYPPVYNLFGIKAPVGAKESDYVSVWTTEYDINNQPYRIVDKFKKFKNYEEAFSYYANLFTRTAWLTNYYKAVVAAKTPEQAAKALTGTYATDPNYGNKLLEIVEQYNLRQYDRQIYPGGVK